MQFLLQVQCFEHSYYLIEKVVFLQSNILAATFCCCFLAGSYIFSK